MRRRLYFLLPDVESARAIHNELLLAKIEERHMHVMAKEGIDLKDLPRATLLQSSDLAHGLQLGLVIGAITGLTLSSLAYLMGFFVPGWEVWSVSSISVGGAFLGAFASSMIAVNVRNTRLVKFQSDIEAGRILFMVDARLHRLEQINKLVHARTPQADIRGVDPQIPAFP